MGNVMIDLYQKLADRNSLLPFKSNHPIAIKQSLLRSQFQWVGRTVSDKNKLPERLQEMSTKCIRREYPETLLKREMDLTLSGDKGDKRQTGDSGRIVCVTTYHPIMPLVLKAVHKESYPQIR